MPFSAQVIRVLIASPGDTAAARRVIKEILEHWNSLNAEDSSIVILPVMWERDATPAMGDRPQAIINRQIVDVADVLVGVFWTRLGTPTGEAESGTVEEVERFIAAKKPVLLFFSNEPVLPASVDTEEYERLAAFKNSLGQRGLYESYADEHELWRKLNAGITRVMRDHFSSTAHPSSTASVPDGPHASLVATVAKEREINGMKRDGSPRYSTRRRLVVENVGTAAAESMSFSFEPTGDGAANGLPRTFDDDAVVTRLPAGGQLDYPLIVSMGTARQWDVVFRWQEAGKDHEVRQTLRL